MTIQDYKAGQIFLKEIDDLRTSINNIKKMMAPENHNYPVQITNHQASAVNISVDAKVKIFELALSILEADLAHFEKRFANL